MPDRSLPDPDSPRPSFAGSPSPVTGGDLIVALFWLVLATASWAVSRSDEEGPLRFSVSVDGVITDEVALGDEPSTQYLTVTGPAGVSTLEIRSGRVRVIDSPCRQHVCIRAGWLSQPGDLAVCVPNGLVVRVSGRRQDGLDAVTR